MTSIRLAMFCLAATVLAACGSPAPTSSSVRRLAPAEMLAQVRAIASVDKELDVQPLRDPQVEDLRQAATRAEAAGDFVAADRALARALQIAPDDPELLQWSGEMALLGRDWAQAEQQALRSFAKGPKLGSLCRRNWATVGFAREMRNDEAGADQARQRIPACAVTPPPRY